MTPDRGTPVPRQTRQISLDTIRDAAGPVSTLARRTPIVPLDPLRANAPDVEILLKLETLQPVGSFKIRGAANAVHALTRDEHSQGVWTVSAGNAAQGVALAARAVGVSCTVLLIETAPETKIDAIERLGARVVKASYDECWEVSGTTQDDLSSGALHTPLR